MKLAIITASLRRSSLRRKVLRCLIKSFPEGLRISDICRRTQLSVNEVIGAIRGIEGQYLVANSLLSLEPVEEIQEGMNGRMLKLYLASKDALKNFGDYGIDA